MKKIFTVRNVLWVIYLALLLVLLPHLAWAAEQFEPKGGKVTAWAFAIAFELVIAVLTYKLRERIEKTPRSIKSKNILSRLTYQYVNPFSIGLVFFVSVSALGNLAHAWQFGMTAEIQIVQYVPFTVFAVAFGAALPLANLLFAQVLSEEIDTEADDSPELIRAKSDLAEAKKANTELRSQVKATEELARQTEASRQQAEARFAALGDLVIHLFGEAKTEQIIAARKLWPGLPAKAIAVIAASSESHVSEVLKTIEEPADA